MRFEGLSNAFGALSLLTSIFTFTTSPSDDNNDNYEDNTIEDTLQVIAEKITTIIL